MLGIVSGLWKWSPRCVPAPALLVVGIASMLAGCAPMPLANSASTATAATQTPALHFILEANGFAAVDTHDGHLAWWHKLAAPVPDIADSTVTPPVLANGLLYLSYYVYDPQQQIHHAILEALDPATRQLRWLHVVDPQDETEIANAPVVSGATVYLSVEAFRGQGGQQTEAGLVEALDSRTGAVRWDKALPQPPTMAAVAGERLFVMTRQTSSGHLIALKAQNGSILWDYAANAPLSRGGDADNGWSDAPIVSGQRVYVQAVERFSNGSADVVQLAVKAGDGTLAWKYDTKGIAATPAFDQSGDTLCLSAYLYSNSSVAGLDAATGRAHWQRTLPNLVSGCAAAGATFYLSQGRDDDTAGSILALNSRDGQQMWQSAVGAPMYADGALVPSVSGSLVTAYLDAPLSPTNGVMATIVVMRASDGTLVWKHDFAGRPNKVMDIEGDQIYNAEYMKMMPIITAYSLTTGAQLWTYTLGNS